MPTPMTKEEKQLTAIREILGRNGLTAETAVGTIRFMLENDLAPTGSDIDDLLRRFVKL